MGYKICIQDLTTAWYNLINGVSGIPNAYKESVDTGEAGNYVLIRAEGQTTEKNKGLFQTVAVIIIEIVTVFEIQINRATVDEIDEVITELVFPSPSTHGLGELTNHHISSVKLQSSVYNSEDDGTRKYYSKISRYEHIINQ